MTQTRPEPNPRPLEEPYWRGGADGQLLIQRCGACHAWIHPPLPRCPKCLSTDVTPEPVSGDGLIYSLAINHQPWDPRMAPPYVFASIELVEQPALRVISTIIDCPPDQPSIGDAVHVDFETVGSWFVPVFRLAESR